MTNKNLLRAEIYKKNIQRISIISGTFQDSPDLKKLEKKITRLSMSFWNPAVYFKNVLTL